MPRKVTSPWDFGELFPQETTRRVLSVAEVTARIKGILESQVGELWVAGEISNLRVQSSGHAYFTLKDAGAQLCCVLFRSTAVADRAAIRDGQRVIVQGEVTVYEPRGQYQLIVRAVEVQGVGALQAAFERLKLKLHAEGLFDSARKRPIPRFPRRVGLITSPTGAAIRDVLHTMERRFAGIELVLIPCRVQGTGASAEIAAAVAALNAWSGQGEERGLDAILVTRGGGSLEDLWAFNEENVARAIAASRIPVISAVGHEIDFTISDLVADLRAATPTAAAELLTACYVEARDWLVRQQVRMGRFMVGAHQRETGILERLQRRLARLHPQKWLVGQMQRLDELEGSLRVCVREVLDRREQRLSALAVRLSLVRPGRRLVFEQDRARQAEARLRVARASGLRELSERLERLRLRLGLLSPVHVLARGYSITRNATTGQVLRGSEEAGAGLRLRTRLYSGEVTSVVTSDEPGVESPRGGAE